MKKLFIPMIAAFLAVMLAAPVYAADNLELSGSYFARGWSVDNNNGVDDADQDYFDQRFRVFGKINVADDVHAAVRADIAEATWGDTFTGGITRPDEASEFQVDRTYLSIDKEMWSLTVGQQYMGLGHTMQALDANVTGAIGVIKTAPVDVSLIYGKLDEGTSVNDDASTAAEDMDIYAVNTSFQVGEFDSNLYYAMLNDDQALEMEPWMLGASMEGAVGGVNLTGEITTFGGDNANNVDYVGTQVYLGASYAVNDMITVGGELLWAGGTDDTDEEQISDITNGGNDWWDFAPHDANTPQWGWTNPFGLADPYQVNNNSGVEAITFYVDATPMEKLSIGSKLGYFGAEEDNTVAGTTPYDSITLFNAYVSYTIATNTDLSLTYINANPDEDDAVADETMQMVMAQIALSF